jgi:hypothetical protein
MDFGRVNLRSIVGVQSMQLRLLVCTEDANTYLTSDTISDGDT